MEELIKEINKNIEKCNISLNKPTIINLEKAHLLGMIQAYNRVIFEIELNKEYYIQEILNNIKIKL